VIATCFQQNRCGHGFKCTPRGEKLHMFGFSAVC
jgi:hypothetical protein